MSAMSIWPPASSGQDNPGRETRTGRCVSWILATILPFAATAHAATNPAVPSANHLETTVKLSPMTGTSSAAGRVTFAIPFVSGHVKHGLSAYFGGGPGVGTAVPLQMDVKRRYADGSVRHAILTAELPSLSIRNAGDTKDLQIWTAKAGPIARSAPSEAGKPSPFPSGFNTKVEIAEGRTRDANGKIINPGVVYSTDVRQAWKASDQQQWLAGALANEYHIVAPLKNGDVVHRALQVVFDVRVYSESSVRVSAAIENVFSDEPGDRSYEIKIIDKPDNDPVLAPTQVKHLFQTRWRTVHYWGTAGPAVNVRYDVAYLRETGAIPRYDPARVVSPSALNDLYQRWEVSPRNILERGLITAYFPNTGGRPDIAPLPDWAAMALISGDSRANTAMLDTGDRAGSFAVHYRDRNNAGRLLSIKQHPTVSLNPAAAVWSDPADRLPSCAPENCTTRRFLQDGSYEDYTPDPDHQPSMAYVPYLVTGDSYFLDELYFWANWNLIEQNQDYRGLDKGWINSHQMRGEAWSLRTLAHAAWIAPDAHPEKAYFEEMVANNIAWYNVNAVRSNPFEFWEVQSNSAADGGRPDPNMDSSVKAYISPWQVYFMTWAFGNLVDLGYVDAAPMRDWLGNFVVGEFTNPDVFNPIDGTAYHLADQSVSGLYYTNYGDVWKHSFANRTTVPVWDNTCLDCYAVEARMAVGVAFRARLPNAQMAYDYVYGQYKSNPNVFSDNPKYDIVP